MAPDLDLKLSTRLAHIIATCHVPELHRSMNSRNKNREGKLAMAVLSRILLPMSLNPHMRLF